MKNRGLRDKITRIDLIWIHGEQPVPEWSIGEVLPVTSEPASVAHAVAGLDRRTDAVLFWDSAFGAPDIDRLLEMLSGPGDVWHCGLRLGMGGLPHLIDFVDPVWRFNRDPMPDREAVSWRLSLRACLVRGDVLRVVGGPDPRFDTLAGAALELGHRWIAQGAMMRHIPDLLPDNPTLNHGSGIRSGPTLADEFRFIALRYGPVWAIWAGWRAWRNGESLSRVSSAYRRGRLMRTVAPSFALHDIGNPIGDEPSGAADALTVSVLIPTLDRYPHLFTLLDDLRSQTVPPLEIIVIDQTEGAARDTSWPSRFTDLPLRVIWRDAAGQCSSRNAGLAEVRGQTVLFLDDDDEIPPDLIAAHLAFLARFSADASCGVAEELGAGLLPAAFRVVRESDVFPTNNALLRMDALAGSGLFDLAYERGERADGDLGMRLYLSGKTLGLNPGASVIHLHAPRGGLRRHHARVVTRGASRGSLRRRHLLAPTEGYLWSRYFSPRQQHEALLIRTVGTLRGNQHGFSRLVRAAVMGLLLPDTWRQNRARLAQGRLLLVEFPSIPEYEPATTEELSPV